MRTVHPAFDPVTCTWFTSAPEPAGEARTLAALQRQLKPGLTIIGYYPDGFAQTSVDRGFDVTELRREADRGNYATRGGLRFATAGKKAGRPRAVAPAPNLAAETRRGYMREYMRARRQRMAAAGSVL